MSRINMTNVSYALSILTRYNKAQILTMETIPNIPFLIRSTSARLLKISGVVRPTKQAHRTVILSEFGKYLAKEVLEMEVRREPGFRKYVDEVAGRVRHESGISYFEKERNTRGRRTEESGGLEINNRGERTPGRRRELATETSCRSMLPSQGQEQSYGVQPRSIQTGRKDR